MKMQSFLVGYFENITAVLGIYVEPPQSDMDSPAKFVFSMSQQTPGAGCCGFDSGHLDLF